MDLMSVIANPRRRWKALYYPIALFAHKYLNAGYGNVNICRGAWMTPSEGFPPLWHWRHYGEAFREIPKEVLLRCARCKVSIHEGLLVLTETGSAWGCNRRISITGLGTEFPKIECDGPVEVSFIKEAICFSEALHKVLGVR